MSHFYPIRILQPRILVVVTMASNHQHMGTIHHPLNMVGHLNMAGHLNTVAIIRHRISTKPLLEATRPHMVAEDIQHLIHLMVVMPHPQQALPLVWILPCGVGLR